MPNIPKIKKGQKITATWLNSLVDAITSATKITSFAPIEVTQNAGGTTIRFAGDSSSSSCKWFYTTSAIGYGTVQGSTVTNASLAMGSGTARSCSTDSTGKVTPDQGASDDTIYNGLSSPSVPIGSFVVASLIDSFWVIILVSC